MRIAYVCADAGVPVFGRKGSSVHVQQVVRALIDLGARVDLFVARAGGDVVDGLEHVTVTELDGVPGGDVGPRNIVLRRQLAQFGPFDLVYERYSPFSFGALEYARDTGAAAVLEINAPLIDEQAAHRSLIDRTGAEQATDRAFRAAHVIIAVSEEVARRFERSRVSRDRVHVVPNGVDSSRFHPDVAPASPAPPGVFTVGFIGSMKPWHGLPVLFDAFERLYARSPKVRLVLVGDGPLRSWFEERAYAHDLGGAVHFVGAVDPASIPAWLTSMDVTVAPYTDAVDCCFSPLKVYESMAAEVPVVASAAGQLRQLINDGVDGILCPPRDAAALARALDRLRQRPDELAWLGQAARTTVLREHTWRHRATRILSLVETASIVRRSAAGVSM